MNNDLNMKNTSKLTETPPSSKTFATKVMKRLGYLFDRWQDESEYENFEDYKKNMKAFVEDEGGSFNKMTQLPFAVLYQDEFCNVTIRATSKEFTTNFTVKS